MNLYPSCVVLLLVAGTSAFGIRASDQLTLSVSPVTSFAPANLFVRVGIDPRVENRGVEVEAESETFYRSSFIQLDGDKAPRTATLEIRSLPSGVYEIRAVLLDSTGHHYAAAQRQVTVVPMAAER